MQYEFFTDSTKPQCKTLNYNFKKVTPKHFRINRYFCILWKNKIQTKIRWPYSILLEADQIHNTQLGSNTCKKKLFPVFNNGVSYTAM